MDISKLTIDGKKLQEARGDIPRSKVAQRVGISRTRLWQIENNFKQSKPSAEVLARLCALYGKDISEFTTEAVATS